MSDLNWNKLPWRKSSFSSDSANCVEVAWRTSSFCHQGSCVEVGWTSSSLCAGGDCVEVKSDKAQILVRDSKLGDDSPVLRFAVESWWVLTDAIVTAKDEDKDGRVWMHVRHRSVAYEPDGHVVLSTSVRSPRLRFTEDEWKAFVFGVQVKEFDPDRLSSPVSSSGTEDTGTVESLPVWGLDPEAATGTAEQGCGAVPVAAESSPPDDWFARQLDADCASIDTPADRLAGRGSLLPASTPDDPRSGGQPGPYVAEITWSEDPSLGEPQGSPVGRPVDVSTDEVDLSSAVQPGSDAAGTGVPPDPVPAAPEEPPSRSLVLFERQVDMEVWFRDDVIAAEAFGSYDDERWFKCGDYDGDPMCWENVLAANKDVWPSLLTRSVVAPLVSPDGAL
jgi:hypothetical protein